MNRYPMFGVDYYPEHWPEERWALDAELMRDMGIEMVRMAEFSWHKFESAEGVFTFEWLDRAIDTLGRQGIVTVLGTPTATPPAWIVEAEPAILPLDSQGRVRGFGGRHHDCQSNPVYRRHIRRLVSEMAQRYANHPHVVGWQTDNELGNSHQDLCHCVSCRSSFQQWLKEKYGTVEVLNLAWGTVFWSQTYDRFEQIPTPTITPNSHNPSLLLDWKRFHSDLVVDFQQVQIDILRDKCPNQFITHNFMGFFDSLDYFDLAHPVDFISHDQYPMGFFDKPQPGKEPHVLAATLDLMRGLKGKPFWIMEQQAGQTGWEIMGQNPKPGQLALWSAQSVAHGADAVVWFRWRTCTVGTEQYWHGILPHTGVPGRRYQELQHFISVMKPWMPAFRGAMPKAEVAILFSYEQNWSFEIQPHHPDLDYIKQVQLWYKSLFEKNVPVDFIGEDSDLSQYKLVLAPLQHLMTEERANRFTQFITDGGVMLLTMRAGIKTPDNLCLSEGPLPGWLTGLLGVELEDYDCLRTQDAQVGWGDAQYHGSLWCDVVRLCGAGSLATFTGDWYAGAPAYTHHSVSKGHACYVATVPDKGFANHITEHLMQLAGVTGIQQPEDGLEWVCRQNEEKTWLFALNHGSESREVKAPDGYHCLTQEGPVSPYGFALYCNEK